MPFCPKQRKHYLWCDGILFLGLQGQYVCSDVSQGPCACIFKVTNWFMWITKQGFIETSQPAFDLKRCKYSEDHRFSNSHCENTKSYNLTFIFISRLGADILTTVSGIWPCMLPNCRRHDPAVNIVIPRSNTVLEKRTVLITICNYWGLTLPGV